MEPAAAALALPLNPDAVRIVGIVALLAYLGTVLLVGRDGRQFSVFGHALWLPDRRTMLGVTVLSVIELVLASAAFYVLLPDSTPTGLPGFVGLYLVAVLAGLVSTVPAGLGVFEWSLLKLLPQVAPAAVLAAALIYRVTYYVLPLVLATLLALRPRCASRCRPVPEQPVPAGTHCARGCRRSSRWRCSASAPRWSSMARCPRHAGTW